MKKGSLKIKTLNHSPDDTVFLYRYFSIDKLLDFLANGRITFTRLDAFEDKLEGTTHEHLLVNYGAEQFRKNNAEFFGSILKHITLNAEPKKRNSLRRQKEQFQQNNFASCWYMSNHESVAMWKIYSETNSVALKISLKHLKEAILSQNFIVSSSLAESLTLGQMKYCRFDEIDDLTGSIVNQDEQGFLKDKSFEHEREYRFIISKKQTEQSKAKKNDIILDEQVERMNLEREIKVLYLSFQSFSELPFEIVFHPQSQKWHRQNIEKIMFKFDLPFKLHESSLKEIFE